MNEDVYWERYAKRFRTFPSLIKSGSSDPTGLIVCIPVLAEPELFMTLDSLLRCDPVSENIEVILLFNKNCLMSVEEIRFHDQVWDRTRIWVEKNNNTGITFLPVYVNELPDPRGGVGWSRKLAMDEAARRIRRDGIIVCLDADCTVAENYFQEILNSFTNNVSLEAASIYFEHLLDDTDEKDRAAILAYELHLRYLIHAQRWCGHPFAFYTVGSAMAVRREAYLAQGGMNTKRAGEDFYFLQKFIETERLFEIRATTVFPSSRVSNRVPFGTGRAMQQIKLNHEEWLTTHFEIFRSIRPLFHSLDMLWRHLGSGSGTALHHGPGLSNELLTVLQDMEFEKEINGIYSNSGSFSSFRKRFFRYFNAFKMIRYAHRMRNHFPDVEVNEAVNRLFQELGFVHDTKMNNEALFFRLRQEDRLI